MINMQELRKGNMVKCLSHLPIGYYMPSYPHTEVLEIKDSGVETEAGSHKYKEIAPIILTEKIILESGGIKVDDTYVFRDNETDPLPIPVRLEGDQFFLGNKNEKYSIAIDSVHHLQNLYYALKGTEIKIKL